MLQTQHQRERKPGKAGIVGRAKDSGYRGRRKGEDVELLPEDRDTDTACPKPQEGAAQPLSPTTLSETQEVRKTSHKTQSLPLTNCLFASYYATDAQQRFQRFTHNVSQVSRNGDLRASRDSLLSPANQIA